MKMSEFTIMVLLVHEIYQVVTVKVVIKLSFDSFGKKTYNLIGSLSLISSEFVDRSSFILLSLILPISALCFCVGSNDEI